MKIYQYTDYQEYVKVQTEANVEKINLVHVTENTIRCIAQKHGPAGSIMCHGTRNGAEQKLFGKYYPDATIIGTEISFTAGDFPLTVQWDFHHDRPDWINKFDIVYSNSFDHSIDPRGALTTWSDQLTDLGCLYLEHSFHVKSRAWDPLEIQSDELEHLFSQVGLCVLSTTPTSAATGLKSLMYQLKRT